MATSSNYFQFQNGDDMSAAKAMSKDQGFHQRSPSMMIVVPLLEDDEHDSPLVCDDLNASYFDFFQVEKEDSSCSYNNNACIRSSSLFDSPKSVVPDIYGTDAQAIPSLTNLIKSTTFKSSKSRRSRNRAISGSDFDLKILPNLCDAQIDYNSNTEQHAALPSLPICPCLGRP